MSTTAREPNRTVDGALACALGEPWEGPHPACEEKVAADLAAAVDPDPNDPFAIVETITDGLHRHAVTAKGLAALSKRARSGARSPARPHARPAAPRATYDRDEVAYVTRLSAVISRSLARRAGWHIDAATAVIGRDAGAGYYIVSTDGYRALLRKGQARQPGATNIAIRTTDTNGFSSSDDLVLALGRMRAANAAKQPGVSLAIDPTRARLLLSTRDPEDQTEAREWVKAGTVTTRPPLTAVKTRVDLRYLLDALRLPGQVVYLGTGQNDSPLMIDTADHALRVVIMPQLGAKGDEVHFAEAADTTSDTAASAMANAIRYFMSTSPDSASISETPTTGGSTIAATVDSQVVKPPKAPKVISTRYGVDWRAAGLKAAETRRRNQAARLTPGYVPPTAPPTPDGQRTAGQKAADTRRRNRASRADDATTPTEGADVS